MVDIVMKDFKPRLLFCWVSHQYTCIYQFVSVLILILWFNYLQDGSKCTETGHKTLENNEKPLVLKQLRKLWHKEDPDLLWEQGDYSTSNTLLVDDSPYKALRNPVFVETPPYVDLSKMITYNEMTHCFYLVQPHTGIFPHSYNYRNRADDSLGRCPETLMFFTIIWLINRANFIPNKQGLVETFASICRN